MNPVSPRILLIDDDLVALTWYDTVLESFGFRDTESVADARGVLNVLQQKDFDLILLDLNMPHVTGMEQLEFLREQYPAIPVVVITAEDKVETAVECMRLGAFDFLTKPVDRNRLVAAARNALQVQELRREVSLLSSKILTHDLRHPEAFSEIAGGSERMRDVFRYTEAVAQSPKAVLITGESGTGKELIARAVHRISRPEGKYVAVNVSGLDDTVFSDTLFGHRKGAFTGADSDRKGLIEQARGGTLFLDEIGDLEVSTQVKLLRLLQEGEFYPLGSDEPEIADARVVAATNADLLRAMEEGRFRKDLYFRLMAHHVELPPLRDRREDLPVLVSHFLEEASSSLGKPVPRIEESSMAELRRYSFPGNIRELQSMIYDAVSRSAESATVLTLSPPPERQGAPGREEVAGAALAGAAQSLQPDLPDWRRLVACFGSFPTVAEAEAAVVRAALDQVGGNQSAAAKMLGVSQSTLSRRYRQESRFASEGA